MTKLKIRALANVTGTNIKDINISYYDNNIFEIYNQKYLVLTDEEVDKYYNYFLDDHLTDEWSKITDCKGILANYNGNKIEEIEKGEFFIYRIN